MQKFWQWYEKNYILNVGIAAILFSLQLVHLFWLFTDVIWGRLFGYAIFSPEGIYRWAIILVDYTEIPAIVTTSLVYINSLRKKFSKKSFFLLMALLIQVVHIFWITDEFVVTQFGDPLAIPSWLSWIAISIDYLELPVIVATLREFFSLCINLSKGKGKKRGVVI